VEPGADKAAVSASPTRCAPVLTPWANAATATAGAEVAAPVEAVAKAHGKVVAVA
jgi:hypothetical protein